MAAGSWTIFGQAKYHIGASNIDLTGVFIMALCRTSASASLLNNTYTGISTWASVAGEISARGGYAAGGRTLSAISWGSGASTNQLKFTYTTTGIVYTASGSDLNGIKYAVIRNSTGAAAGKVLCFCTLSTASFSITSPNTLTIYPNASGVFTLA